MYKQRSVVSSYFYSFTLIFLLFVLGTGSVWIYNEIVEYTNEFQNIRLEYLASKKRVIKNEVEKVVADIQYHKSIAEKRLKTQVKLRTYEAYDMAMNLYQQHKNKKSVPEIKQLVHDALFSVAWDNGKGYYFAEDMQGNEIINRNNPELEGKNLSHVTDSKGTVVMQEIFQAVQNEKGEGFCRYYWNKPGIPDVLHPKISFIKYFKPFDWVIGNGKYLDEEESVIKKEILSRIESITYGEAGYIFAGNFEGITLAGPAKGKNMLGSKDPNGVYIVKELISRAKKGGGFVHYVMPGIEGNVPRPKVSYAQGIPDWKWYIGSGIYLHAIESVINEKQTELNDYITLKIIQGVTILSLIVLIAFLIARFFTKRVEQNLSLFDSFFKNAAAHNAFIDIEKTYFSEFNSMAHSANQMVSQRQRVQKELEVSKNRFQNIIHNTRIAMMITDTDNQITFLNPEFTELFGYKANDLSSVDDFLKRVCPDERKRNIIQSEWQILVNDSGPQTSSHYGRIWELEAKDSSLKTVECFYSLVGNNEGLSSFTDLTDQKEAEKEKLTLEVQLMQAQKMEAIGLMAGGVAHDLNNILSGVIAYPELMMLQLPEDDPMRSSLETILDSGKRAAEVVADLLTIARGVKNTKNPANLNTLVADYLSSPEYSSMLSYNPGVSVKFIKAEELLNFNCSDVHIKKCIMNIVSNGAEAISGPGSIIISTENRYIDTPSADNLQIHKGEYVVLKITDTGTGISDEDIDRIFEPFYTKKVMGKSGTGLGLAVVWNTVIDHGGGINVSSSDAGTTFELFFPVTRSAIDKSEDKVDISELKGNGELVLVIDDETVQQDIASLYLKTLGYRSVAVSSGEEAVDYLKTNSVDILLLDMIMVPGINGRETYEKIAKIHPGQKAVIASGYSESEEVKKLNKLGVANYIKKPYLLNEIGRALKEALHSD